MKNIVLVLFVLAPFVLLAQQVNMEKPVIAHSLYFGIGSSHFNTTPSASSKFQSLELRLGPAISIPLGSSFQFNSRFLFGAKLKREAYNVDGQAYVIGPPYLELDEVASSRNHYFIEIPAMFAYTIQRPKLSIYTGLNYRFFMPNNEDVDFLTNRGDLGILSGVSCPIKSRWNLGAEYLFGITKVYSYDGTVDGTEVNGTASNNTIQFFIQYRFKKISPE